MTNNNQAAEREAFECRVYALAEKERYEYLPSLFKRNHLSTEDYATTWVDMMWKGWQARAALAQPASSEEPGIFCYGGTKKRSDCASCSAWRLAAQCDVVGDDNGRA